MAKVKIGSEDGKIDIEQSEFQVLGEHLEKIEGDTLKIKDKGQPTADKGNGFRPKSV